MTGPDYLVCERDLPGRLAIIGGHIGHCSSCDHAVLISPSGVQRIRNTPAMRTVCVECATAAGQDIAAALVDPADVASDLARGARRRR